MEINQIYQLVNTISGELLGRTDIVNEDLTGVVDLGIEIFNQNAVDNYVRSLVNHIGKVIFVNRPYRGKVPSVLMDSWEFGSVLEKISADIPEAQENDTWNLQDKQEYKQDIFYKPSVSAKFFNSRVTFEVPISITERQVKESFSNAAQLNGFISMIYNAVDKSMSIKMDALVMRTISNMIGETFAADKEAFGGDTPDYPTGSTNRCVNLLKLYNDANGGSLTAEQAIYNPDFIRYASYVLGMYVDRLGSISTLFNIAGKERFTPVNDLHVVLLSSFAKAADVFLYSETRHNELVKMPKHEVVPFWQASGKDYSFADTSDIHVTTSGGNVVNVAHVVAVMFDRDALGVSNLERRVTSNYNAKAEFYNNYYKFDAGYFNDTNENFVVFYLA